MYKRQVFTVQIPKGKSHFDESCVFLSNATESSSGVAHLDISQVQETLNKKYDYTILIVEDDWDIRCLQRNSCEALPALGGEILWLSNLLVIKLPETNSNWLSGSTIFLMGCSI